jgi:hypothetical protein
LSAINPSEKPPQTSWHTSPPKKEGTAPEPQNRETKKYTLMISYYMQIRTDTQVIADKNDLDVMLGETSLIFSLTAF